MFITKLKIVISVEDMPAPLLDIQEPVTFLISLKNSDSLHMDLIIMETLVKCMHF